MAVHPTFTHAAADLRRQSLLAEADAARRSQPEHERLRVRSCRHVLMPWLEHAVGIVSRIVDDFEGNVGSTRTASHLHSPRLPLARSVRWQRSWRP
jgi:hypothetical protein